MNILEIISKKQSKKELTKQEIQYFIKGYTNGKIPDYQAAALIMAIFINGMTDEETTYLTLEMANSGEVLDLSTLGSIIVDKHSTGGVGDKISIILLPIVASLGVKVAKMSGRGLSFTGGTADKLDAIPGYKTEATTNTFIKDVEKVGISMITQTLDLAPADKKIYALRDTISCVESIPLIASSIMSKKIASGADKILIDVTVGSGAFMENVKSAKELANQMIEIGKIANKQTICILTNMNEPLGFAVGNTLEVIEAVDCLKGNLPEDIKQIILDAGSYMLKLAGINDDIEENKQSIIDSINSGMAFEKFLEMVESQGGDISYIKNTDKFEKSKYIENIYSEEDGFVQEINARKVGMLCCNLGAGRMKKEDSIDYTVGIVLRKKVGDKVYKGEAIAQIHSNSIEKLENAKKELLEIIKIDNIKKEKEDMILEVIK